VAGALEVTISLLAGTAGTALLWLQGHLRQQPDLIQDYKPACLDLERQLNLLSPLHRVEIDG
jgi:hypothetical protein